MLNVYNSAWKKWVNAEWDSALSESELTQSETFLLQAYVECDPVYSESTWNNLNFEY
jgi:hypothetical protein